MDREALRKKISDISNSDFPLIDFFNDIEFNCDKRFNKKKAYKDIEKIYLIFEFYILKTNYLELKIKYLERKLKDEKE